MRIWALTSFLGLVLVLGACVSKSNRDSAPPALEDLVKSSLTKPDQVLSWLDRCAQACLNPDREIARQIASGYHSLYGLAESGPAVKWTDEQRDKFAWAQAQVRVGFIQILKIKTNRDLLVLALHELINPGLFGEVADPEVSQILRDGIKRLKADRETQSTGWFLEGYSLTVANGDLLSAIGAFRECLRTEAADAGCLDQYKQLVQYYQRPRCLAADIANDFGLAVPGSAEPFLKGIDFLEVAWAGPADGPQEIAFELKSFSVSKLRKLPLLPESPAAKLIVRKGEERVQAVVALVAVNEGQMRMTLSGRPQAEQIFQSLCQKPSTWVLPSKLQL